MAYISIDIGSDVTKIISLSFQSGIHQYIVDHAFLIKTPRLSTNNIDYQSLAKEVNALFEEHKIVISALGLVISGQQSNILVIDLPKMPKRELLNAVVTEARNKIIPAPSPDAVFDYILLGEKHVSGVVRQEVFVVCTEKRNIERQLEFLTQLGCMAKTISVSAFALAQILSKNKKISKDEEAAVLDIGSSISSMTIVRSGRPCFYRNVFVGCTDVVNALVNELSVDRETAGTIFIEHGIPNIIIPKDSSKRVAITEEIMRQKYERAIAGKRPNLPAEVNLTELKVAQEPVLEKLIGEIRRSLSFYKEHSGGGRIEKLFITGGGALVKGLKEYLTPEFGGDIEILDPIKEITVAKDDLTAVVTAKASIFSTAIGGGIELISQEYRSHINLLPEEIRSQDSVARKQLYMFLASVIILILWICGLLFVEFKIMSLSKMIGKQNETVVQLDGLLNKLNSLEAAEGKIKAKDKLFRELKDPQLDWTSLFIAVAKSLPQGVGLNKIEVKKSEKSAERGGRRTGRKKEEAGLDNWQIEIAGEINADYETAIATLSQFVNRLKGLKYFKELNLEPLPMENVIYRAGEIKEGLTVVKKREFKVSGIIFAADE
ncbi:MAG: type IV pilus assembly protein PilM [Candidatus Omnitrophota bacterium]